MAGNIGLEAANYGLSYGSPLNPTFASPSTFALASLAFPGVDQSRSKPALLIAALDDIVAAADDERIDIERLPMLKQVLFTDAKRDPRAAYETLRSWVLRELDSVKLLERDLITPLNGRGALISRSQTGTTSVRVQHLKPRRDPQDIVIDDAFGATARDASYAVFNGGSTLVQHSSKRFSLFSEYTDVDRPFWNKLDGRERSQYKRQVAHVDFPRALALSAINWISTHRRDLMTGEAARARGESFIPFDYALHPDQAFELVLQRFAPMADRARAGLPRTQTRSQQEIDQFA